MTTEQKKFAAKWLNKTVCLAASSKYEMPRKTYVVTAALLDWENGQTIFAVKALDYSFENKHWFTFKGNGEEDASNFEIIE